jgi:hypothetical protein
MLRTGSKIATVQIAEDLARIRIGRTWEGLWAFKKEDGGARAAIASQI